MITYELAKKLKDAGFPQKTLEDDFVRGHWVKDVYAPSLEELIEVCGQDFEELVFTDAYEQKSGKKTMWRAYMSEEAFAKTGIACVRDCDGYEIGESPEEAVANLWLALKEPVPTPNEMK